MELNNPGFQYLQTEKRIKKYVTRGFWEGSVFYNYLERNLERVPENEAIVDSRVRITFSDLGRIVDNLASNLLELGVGGNDVLCVQVPNRAEYFYMRYALAKIGAVILGIGVGIRKRELQYLLGLTKAKGIVAPVFFHRFDYTEMITDLRDEFPSLQYIFFTDSQGRKLPQGAYSFEEMCADRVVHSQLRGQNYKRLLKGPNEIDMLSLTSGTTGLPKVCQFTPNRRMLFGKQIAEYSRMTSEDTMLVICPIPQGVGNSCSSLAAAHAGAKLVLQDRFDPEEALRLIEKERATILVGVPTQTIRLLSLPDFDKYDCDSLRLVISAGSYLPYETAREIIKRFDAKLMSIFGSHDGGTICMGTLDLDEEAVCRTVGRLLPDTELKVVDLNGREVPQGEVGEFLYRSANGSAGYFGDLEATKVAWDAEGYFHSGDLGRLTDEGLVEVKGRVKDIIIRGGQNINPEEIEDILIDHPDIENVAVVGMPDPVLGERCCAYVAPRKGRTFTFDQMIDFLKKKEMAIYKFPERLELIDEIPVSEGTKPKKDALKRDILNKLKEEGVIKDN